MAIELEERPVAEVEADEPALSATAPDEDLGRGHQDPLKGLYHTALASFLAVAAAGWIAAGIFPGVLPRLYALGGAALGVAITAGSYRSRRPALIQWLSIPVALVAASIAATAGSRSREGILTLVAEALRGGGLSRPPVPFDPGWRFMLVLVLVVLGTASVGMAVTLRQPRFGYLLPGVLVFLAALIQPTESELASVTVSVLLMVGALAISFGAELTREGASSGAFEVRRLIRAAALLGAVAVALVIFTRLDFLFPDTQREEVIPPTRPKPQPPAPDRVLFTVEADYAGPWRLGVLDGYDGKGWLLPPYDTSRLVDIEGRGVVPSRAIISPQIKRSEVTFVMKGITGHSVPGVANPQRVVPAGGLRYDPRAQTLRVEERIATGLRYRVDTPAQPTGSQLTQAPAPPARMEPYLDAPAMPAEVQALLDQAPENRWDRLAFVRGTFYSKVVASGAGQPVDVPPDRVVEILNGEDATPFEITAAEALLARWAGVPSRIGFGYHSGDKAEGGNVYSVRPRNGATWLEVYFEGSGWVPIVGIPPRAKGSFSDNRRNPQPNIRPSDELGFSLYVPVEQPSLTLLYQSVRYWLARIIPLGALIAVLWWAIAGAAKILRGAKRRRWAGRAGLVQRVAVAYAEFRDAAHDLNIGRASLTPVEFLDAVADDDEHAELAWLVTRALWGDIRRDLQVADAVTAETLSRSIVRRLRKAQSPFNRLLAFGSRVSLNDPYDEDVPNLWPAWARERRLRSILRRMVGTISPRRLLGRTAVMVVVIAMALQACGQQPPSTSTQRRLPAKLVPDSVGSFSFRSEPEAEKGYSKVRNSLIENGRVYTIRRGDDVVAALQAAAFKPGVSALDKGVRSGTLATMAGGDFNVTRVGDLRIYFARLPEQTIYVWFAPGGGYFEVLVARQSLQDADRLFFEILEFQSGRTTSGAVSSVYDYRRGADEPPLFSTEMEPAA